MYLKVIRVQRFKATRELDVKVTDNLKISYVLDVQDLRAFILGVNFYFKFYIFILILKRKILTNSIAREKHKHLEGYCELRGLKK